MYTVPGKPVPGCDDQSDPLVSLSLRTSRTATCPLAERLDDLLVSDVVTDARDAAADGQRQLLALRELRPLIHCLRRHGRVEARMVRRQREAVHHLEDRVEIVGADLPPYGIRS